MAIITSQISAELRPRATLKGTLSGPATLEATVNAVERIYEYDHDKLINRDLDDQHPISAITGLEERLLSLVRADDLARVAFSGLVEDLVQESVLIIDCGTSTEII